MRVGECGSTCGGVRVYVWGSSGVRVGSAGERVGE